MIKNKNFLKLLFIIFGFIIILSLFYNTTNKDISKNIRLLSIEEKETVTGGLFGGGGKGGGVSSSINYDNITLSNVPYYNQTNGIDNNWRSKYYCGLTSTFMVRHMGNDYNSSNYYVYANQSDVDKCMQVVDSALNSSSAYLSFYSLDNGEYLNIVGSATKYNPQYDGGLLYTNSFMTSNQQFEKTKSIINELYTSNLKRLMWDDTLNKTNVNNVSIEVLGHTEVLDKIWNHIRDNKKPVVVVMDSSCTIDLIKKKSIFGMSYSPVLHYNVIVGIKEDSTGKYFIINDPGENDFLGKGEHRLYKAEDYVNSLRINRYVKPDWVYEYAENNHTGNWSDDGCYVMFVY